MKKFRNQKPSLSDKINYKVKYYKFTNLIARNVLPMSSCLIRKKSFSEFIFIESEETRGWEDWHTWIKYSKEGKTIIKVEKPLLYYREHSGSIRYGKLKKMLKCQLKVIPKDFNLSLWQSILFYFCNYLRLCKVYLTFSI